MAEKKYLNSAHRLQRDQSTLLKEMNDKLDKILELNGLSGKPRHRRKKEEGAPKGPRGAWILFSNHKRGDYAAKYPGLKGNELRTKMADDWRLNISEEIKQKYKDDANKDKERYRKEMEQYKKSKKENNLDLDIDDITVEPSKTKSKPKKTKPKPKPIVQEADVDDGELSLDDLDLSDT